MNFLAFAIVCPLVFLAGFVDSIAGGGGLISLPAYLLAGLPVHFAIGTNKLSAFMGATIATGKYAKNGYIPWKLSIICIIFALIGSALGAQLALLLDDTYFKIIILIILPLTAVYVLRGNSLVRQKPALSFRKTAAIGSAAAFFIGMYDGFYGPGTGVFLILMLTALAHMRLQEANGLSKAINWATNISALVVYLVNGKVMLLLGLTAGLFSIVGSYIGTRCFEKKGAASVRPLMLLVLAIFFVKLILDLLG